MSILLHAASELLMICRERRLTVAVAESCTGGLVACMLTATAGASDVFDRGFVTYSNAAKTEMLGVPAGLIASAGAVSEAVAERMAMGALRHSNASVALAITGIAGPGGGTKEKPVGLVWFGVAKRDGSVFNRRKVFMGDRTVIRHEAALHGLDLLKSISS